MSQLQGTSGQSSANRQVQSEQHVTVPAHTKATAQPDNGIQTDTIETGFQPKVAATPYSAMQFPLTKWPEGWKRRPRSPGLRWYKNYDTPESLERGRVLVIDYIRQDLSKEGMRKVAAQEIDSIEGLRRLYSNPERCAEAVLRVLHCQNADWATRFLLHKYNISTRDDLVGTDFGKYVKYKRPERRGGKPFMSGKTWKTTHDPWRGISRTSFGIDYLRKYPRPTSRTEKERDIKDKLFELNHYDEDDLPRYGFDVYVQRLSCYIQHKEPAQDIPDYLESPYREGRSKNNTNHYIPQLETLDNSNTIIIFENSQSGSIEDTIITAREHWESRWRRLPFYLAYESQGISDDNSMALECMKIILSDIWKGIAETWEGFIDVCNTHVSILEEKIYEQPADESRAPELWTNSSMWLKVERLVAVHMAIVKEMQTNLREFLSEAEIEDNWLESGPGDMEKINDLVQEDLTKPTANLADLMYKSVGIRDSRHSLQLSTSMWRLSWITFIFLPLTFTKISSFFGMNVDILQNDPSIRWYFASAVPMMVFVLLLWYFIKHFLARRRQTPYQRGIYEHLFFELATAYPRLWSRAGPNEHINPQNRLDRLKWRLIMFWNDSKKTIQKGSVDSEYDDLGAWARFKRTLTRRWTSQIRVADIDLGPSTTTLEGGVAASQTSFELERKDAAVQPTPVQFMRTSATGDLPGGMLEVPMPESTFTRRYTVPVSRPTSSAGKESSGGSSKRDSGLMVEEEPAEWLKNWGRGGQGEGAAVHH